MIRNYGQTGAFATNSTAGGVKGVECDVCNCYYNKNDRYCTAQSVKDGAQSQNAVSSADTVCSTFRPK